MAESPNVQFGTEVEHKDFDKGTGAWAIKPGPAAIPEVPGAVFAEENFEGVLWTQITFFGGDWVTTGTEFHDGALSFTNLDIDDGETSSFFISNDVGATELRFWLKTDTETGFDVFNVFVDFVEVFEESGPVDWQLVTIPLAAAFETIEFRYTKDSSVSAFSDACFVDEIELGAPGTPAVPARPFVYTPLKMTDDGERLKVETDNEDELSTIDASIQAFKVENDANLDLVNAELDAQTALLAHIDGDLHAANTSLDAIESAIDVALSTRASEATLAAFKTENDSNLDLVNAELDTHTVQLIAANASLDMIEGATYLEDSGHVSGNRGMFALAVRNDTTNGLGSADLDYVPLTVNSAGALRVETVDAGVPGVVVADSAWGVFHNPAANTQATVTQAAPGANRRLVITSARWSSGTTALLGAVQNRTVELFSGAAIYQGQLIHPSAAGSWQQINLENRVIVAPVNTSVIIRFDAAGGANTFQSVAMTGYTVAI